MEAPKLRFVRCPGCLQLLVEYPSIAVYQCGGCGTVLRAKNRVVPVVNTNVESGEHNEFSNSSTGNSQNNKLICIDGQTILPSSNAQPGVVKEKITFASEESTVSSSNSIDSSEHVNIDCLLVDGDASDPDMRMERINDEDKGTVSNSGPESMKAENVGTDGNVNSEKSSFMDDQSIINEVATAQSIVHMAGGGSNSNLREAQSLAGEKCTLSNNNVNSQEIVASCRPDDEIECKSNNVSAGAKDRFQPYEGLHVESHEDLIEELVRSLSLSDDEDNFVDIEENSELNDALRSQMGSCRFSSGSKMNDAPRTDPHGRLIEELEMSFSDSEEVDQNVMIQHNDIVEKVTLDEDGKENHNLEEDGKENNILDEDGKENHIFDKDGKDNCILEKDGKENHILDEDDKYNCILEEDGKENHILDAGGSNSYEERVLPMDDGDIKSGQSFQQNELATVNTEEKEEEHPEETNVLNHAEADSGTGAVLSSLSDDKFYASAILPPSCNKRKEEKSNIYRGRELRQGLSLDSEDFRSIQKFIESQMDGTSSSLSSGSPNHGDLERNTSNRFKKIDRFERLKKMDDLRDQLNRLSSQKGLGNRYKNKGLGHLQQQSSYKHIELHPCGYDADSILDSDIIDSYYDHGNLPRYPPPDAFSPTHSHYHCGHGQPHIPYNCSAWEFNSYYQPSYAGSTILEHESLSSSYKEQKRAVRKSILRSLSGASPFTICNGCFNLVQVPSDIYVSKKKIAKFQCGRCSKALVLSFPATHSEDTKLNQKPLHYTVDGIEGANSFSAELRGDPMRIIEKYGASSSRSFSSRARPDFDASTSGKKASDSALHRLMGYDSASQLLRHSRVFDDGYDSFESMVPVSNRVFRRKNL
ncbi:uncharacterized protein LOC102705581 [Oryza brachyantha]|uniref:uncharacterized protein LOC102705581 n=1 Tax=Oryza brachyantha TaxID=4533 RepID=UPI001ADCD026|nr:uncharacterized protein LOC102705581 [Oryza brachyantha]XP_040385200.1 uncharacterized protein LOC102705581 [Oryza brachyantha]